MHICGYFCLSMSIYFVLLCVHCVFLCKDFVMVLSCEYQGLLKMQRCRGVLSYNPELSTQVISQQS